MSEATTRAKAKAAPAASFFEFPKFELPKYEFAKVELPKFDVPVFYREFAEKTVAQAKDAYEKAKASAEEANHVLEETYATAAKGAAEYGIAWLEAARANTNAAFDFAEEFLSVKSVSEAVELSTAHGRKQFEVLSGQTKELAALAQNVTTKTAAPLKAGVTKAFKHVA